MMGALTLRQASLEARWLHMSSNAEQMIAGSIRAATLSLSQPEALFAGAYYSAGTGQKPYDVAPDGRFVVIKHDAHPLKRNRCRRSFLYKTGSRSLKRLVRGTDGCL